MDEEFSWLVVTSGVPVVRRMHAYNHNPTRCDVLNHGSAIAVDKAVNPFLTLR